MTSPQPTTDEEIVKDIVAGNIDGFADIVQRYEAKLIRYAIYLIHSDAMARDVVQESFIKAYVNLKGLKHCNNI